jgi:hypothetical protein
MASTNAASSTCNRSSHWANSSNTLPILLADPDIQPTRNHGLGMNPRLWTTQPNTDAERPNSRCRMLRTYLWDNTADRYQHRQTPHPK